MFLLDDAARTQHHHAVVVDDSLEAVRNGDQGPVAAVLVEVAPQDLLDAPVGLVVHAGSGLVEQHELALAHEGAAQRQHLPLPVREVVALGLDRRREVDPLGLDRPVAVLVAVALGCGVLIVLERGDATAVLQGPIHHVDGDLVARVEVRADVPGEEDRLLRDDGQGLAELLAGETGNIHAVEEDLAGHDVGETQERQNQRALARPGSSHHGHSFARSELEVDILQNVGALITILDGDVTELDLAVPGPILGHDEILIVSVMSCLAVLFGFLLRLDGSIFSHAVELEQVSIL